MNTRGMANKKRAAESDELGRVVKERNALLLPLRRYRPGLERCCESVVVACCVMWLSRDGNGYSKPINSTGFIRYKYDCAMNYSSMGMLMVAIFYPLSKTGADA